MKTAETALKYLGLISIIIGILGGVLAIIISIIESEFFLFLIGLSCIFAAYVSGYLLIGISNIIELLSSLNRTIKNQSFLNNEEQNEFKKNNPSSSNKKSFIENLEETPSKYTSRNETKNPAESKNRSWSEISDSMKKK